MTDAYQMQRAMTAGLRTVADPDLPPRVRHRLARLNPAALPAQHLPWNQPARNARQVLRVTVAVLAVLGVDLMLGLVVVFGISTFGWKSDWMDGLVLLFVGQLVVLGFVNAGCWAVGAARAVRRRAPVLRRRHAGHYVPVGELAELWLNGPPLGDLVANAVRQRDRLARSRACRERWLTSVVDDRAADAVLWHLTQTALATGDMMDAVCDAAGHPELGSRPRLAVSTSPPRCGRCAPTWLG